MTDKYCPTIEKIYDIRTMPNVLQALLDQLRDKEIDTDTFISGVRAFHQDLYMYLLMAKNVNFPKIKTVKLL